MFKRTEQEVREYLEAIKAYAISLNECDCDVCRDDLSQATAVVDVLGWILGEKPSQEFASWFGKQMTYDMGMVAQLVMRHKVGEFNIKVGT